MKEYKVIRRSIIWSRKKFEAHLNELAKERWEVKSAIGNTYGIFSAIILERPIKRVLA